LNIGESKFYSNKKQELLEAPDFIYVFFCLIIIIFLFFYLFFYSGMAKWTWWITKQNEDTSENARGVTLLIKYNPFLKKTESSAASSVTTEVGMALTDY